MLALIEKILDLIGFEVNQQDIKRGLISIGLYIIVILLLILAFYFFKKWRNKKERKDKLDRPLIQSARLIGFIIAEVFILVLTMPFVPWEFRIATLQMMGALLSAILALSSVTLIGNVLAGIMLEGIKSFRPGDYIRVNDYFGRVTERRLFHTEINMEDGDLMTIPNLYLATNAVKVTKKVTEKIIDEKSSLRGPFLSGVCSLGYDVNKDKVAKALLSAAEKAGLEEAFVRVMELGDFSVTYKVYGMFTKEGHLMMKAQSTLNAMMLEALHEAGIEIVSPAFMNQRQVANTPIIPDRSKKKEKVKQTDEVENILFDKSIKGDLIEELKEKTVEIDQNIENLEEVAKTAETEYEKVKAKTEIEEEIAEKEKIEKQIKEEKDDMDSKKISSTQNRKSTCQRKAQVFLCNTKGE